ncbi:MAG: hypothetical protein GY716_25040 [bacterium]|nr:hypothetical protein [bacterium]
MNNDHSGPTDPHTRQARQHDSQTTRETARELVRLARESPRDFDARVRELNIRDLAELAARLPPEARLELLVNAPRPMRLVRALPDSDLYMTVREVGPVDATPVIGLASKSQLQHLVDLESWRGDRFDARRAGGWTALLLEAGEPTMLRFLRNADDELLALLLRQWARIEQIEYEDDPGKHGHGQGDAGTEQGLMTPDGYHRFSPEITEHGPAIRRMLQIFFTDNAERYQRIMWLSMWELPSELEESALHWRQCRLEEHGFPRREEAFDVYAPPEGATLPTSVSEPVDADSLRASHSALMVLPAEHRLAASIELLGDEVRDRVLQESVALANRILIADGADTGDLDVHRSVLRKAAGFVAIALETRAGHDVEACGRALSENPLVELFREGYARVADLQRRARSMFETGWGAAHDQALDFLDSPIRQRVEALLLPRPLFVPFELGDDAGVARQFEQAAEVEETRVSVEMTEVVGAVLASGLGLDLRALLDGPAPDRLHPPTQCSVLLTVLAWHAERGETTLRPLPAEVSAGFLRNVASRRTAAPDAPERALNALIGSLAAALELEPRSAEVLRSFGRFCVERLSAECGNLDPGVPIDPRHVSCLLLDDPGA